MAVQLNLHTVAEFEHFCVLPDNRDRQFELIHGEIVEKAMPTEEHGVIVLRLGARILAYVERIQSGRVGTEIGTRMPGDEHNARQPDISYFADESRPLAQMPDLAVEVRSPDDSYQALRAKADYYLANGTQAVWLIFPETQRVEVHRRGHLDTLTAEDVLDGGSVMPGFSLPVRDIFPA